MCRARAPELLEPRPGHEVACHIAAREVPTLATPGEHG
jgi:hypothetical protein